MASCDRPDLADAGAAVGEDVGAGELGEVGVGVVRVTRRDERVGMPLAGAVDVVVAEGVGPGLGLSAVVQAVAGWWVLVLLERGSRGTPSAAQIGAMLWRWAGAGIERTWSASHICRANDGGFTDMGRRPDTRPSCS